MHLAAWVSQRWILFCLFFFSQLLTVLSESTSHESKCSPEISPSFSWQRKCISALRFQKQKEKKKKKCFLLFLKDVCNFIKDILESVWLKMYVRGYEKQKKQKQKTPIWLKAFLTRTLLSVISNPCVGCHPLGHLKITEYQVTRKPIF